MDGLVAVVITLNILRSCAICAAQQRPWHGKHGIISLCKGFINQTRQWAGHIPLSLALGSSRLFTLSKCRQQLFRTDRSELWGWQENVSFSPKNSQLFYMLPLVFHDSQKLNFFSLSVCT